MALTADMDPRYGRFTLRTECPACGSHLPINGLHGSPVGCADCGEDVPVPDDLVADLLEAFEDAWPEAQRSGTVTVGDLSWRWASSAFEQAPCPTCGGVLGAPDDAGVARCGQCAAAQPAQRLPRDIGRAAKTARWIIGGERGDTQQALAPVALACPTCGAGLQITSHNHRITPCKACGNQIHVPDAVWRALHPPRKVLPWIIRFEGESRQAIAGKHAMLDALRKAEKEQRKQEHQREKYEAEERKRVIERDAKERQQLALAEEDAARAKWSLPWIGLSWLLCVSGAGVAVTATFLELVAHVPGLSRLGVNGLAANLVADVGVFGAAAWLGAAWVVGNFAVTRRIGSPLSTILVWPTVMLVMTWIPFAGTALALLWVKQCFDGTEPTMVENGKVPRAASLPLALILLVMTFFPYVVWAAISSTAVVARFGR